MIQTETAPTVHGNVAYETVECASCERKVSKENAQRFAIGDGEEISRIGLSGNELHFKRSNSVHGWACDYCASNGPIQYPQESFISHHLNLYMDLDTGDKAFIWLMILTPIVIAATIMLPQVIA